MLEGNLEENEYRNPKGMVKANDAKAITRIISGLLLMGGKRDGIEKHMGRQDDKPVGSQPFLGSEDSELVSGR